MRQQIGRAVIDEPALVEDGNAVVKLEMPQAVGDGEHRSPRAIRGEPPQQVDNLILGLRVEPAGNLVAQQQHRLCRHFDRQRKPPLLPAREHPRPAVGDGLETGIPQDFIGPLPARLRIHAAYAQTQCGLHAFGDRQQIEGDAELRDVADLLRLEVLLGRKIAPFPEDGPFIGLADAGDDLQQCALSGAGRADDRAEVALLEMGGDFPQQHERLSIRHCACRQRYFPYFKHGMAGETWEPWILAEVR